MDGGFRRLDRTQEPLSLLVFSQETRMTRRFAELLSELRVLPAFVVRGKLLNPLTAPLYLNCRQLCFSVS